MNTRKNIYVALNQPCVEDEFDMVQDRLEQVHQKIKDTKMELERLYNKQEYLEEYRMKLVYIMYDERKK